MVYAGYEGVRSSESSCPLRDGAVQLNETREPPSDTKAKQRWQRLRPENGDGRCPPAVTANPARPFRLRFTLAPSCGSAQPVIGWLNSILGPSFTIGGCGRESSSRRSSIAHCMLKTLTGRRRSRGTAEDFAIRKSSDRHQRQGSSQPQL